MLFSFLLLMSLISQSIFFTHRLHCKCGKLAKERGHSFFGLQFYGECWSGPNSYMFFRDGKANQQDCVGVDYKECDDEADTECIGKAFTNYIYSTETGKYCLVCVFILIQFRIYQIIKTSLWRLFNVVERYTMLRYNV